LQAQEAGPGPAVRLPAARPQLPRLPFAGLWQAPQDNGNELAEVAAYLLVWGEAGNVRFMPEVICFITDLVLCADTPEGGKVFSDVSLCRSGAFLARVVRPIYDVVFEENYAEVSVDDKGKDIKKMRGGFEKYMPADCANYDDWNELFCDPARLVHALTLNDGSKLFDVAPGGRLAALERVNWRASLSGCKTHREVHSPTGLFAGIHRVVFLHALLYLATVAHVASSDNLPPDGEIALVGNSAKVRFATVGLLVPFHAALWSIAAWSTSGAVVRSSWARKEGRAYWVAFTLHALKIVARFCAWSFPVLTYAAVRYAEANSDDLKKVSPHLTPDLLDLVHLLVCTLGAVIILEFPGAFKEHAWKLTSVDLGPKLMRWLFWLCVLGVKAYVGNQGIVALNTALDDLEITRLGLEPLSSISSFAFSPMFDKDVVEWCVLMGIGFLVYSADTQFWFSLGCSILGILVAFHQRQWQLVKLSCADMVAQIPESFSKKVLFYDPVVGDRRFSISFPVLWDKVVEHMRYEDKVDAHMSGELTFFGGQRERIDWNVLQQPLSQPSLAAAVLEGHGPVSRNTPLRVNLPQIFKPASCTDRCIRREAGIFSDPAWPRNVEVQWRLNALARAMTLSMPRPFRPPYIPGLTVMIPHYGEAILIEKEELFKNNSADDVVPLMSWLEYRFEDEFRAFTARTSQTSPDFTSRATKWSEYTDADWDKLCVWASMRSQTLWRTVAGLTMYHQALKCHYQLQNDRNSSMGKKEVWDTSEVFTCMISMQMYPYFNATQLRHTNRMLEKFPKSLKVAFIDFEDKGADSDADGVHPNQARRYFSCLIDKNCSFDERGRRQPRLRVELPGFPILGDGKGDNQNHAMPFTRGLFIQAIDANQGAYFEQMLLLPNVLGEFRDGESGMGARKIVGFPEHITSDFGSIGDFAAGAETAFGTILQRSYAALGGRMHYGHPDMMNKTFMMQQGGVSKATKTVNLSEDIFAGMDFTLRGEGRHIQHSEYFHVSKGRDLGFNTVLLFFSKLSAGTGEQLLTRQMARLGERLSLPQFLTLYYAHGGFYLTQFLLSLCVPALVFIWLVVLLDAAEADFPAMDPRFAQTKQSGASVMAQVLVGQYGWLFLLFIVAGAAPLLLETWLQAGLFAAVSRIIKQMMSLSPLHFIFQAKVIGSYVSNEIIYGGAAYVSTGRGLPIERRFFIGVKNNNSGLYNDFAQLAFYDGARLLVAVALVVAAGGLKVTSELRWALIWWFLALFLTLTSWLFAPFIFNPYQFNSSKFKEDWKDWRNFFLSESVPWKSWYEKSQLRPGSGIRSSPASVVGWVIFVFAFYVVLENKIHTFTVVFPNMGTILRKYALGILPPVVLSGCFCLLLPLLLERLSRRPMPLFGFVIAVLVLDSVEAFLALWELLGVGWWNTVLAGVILKYALVSSLLVLCECAFRFKGPVAPENACCQALKDACKLWLLAHRMARDVLVSVLIYAFLAIGVCGDWFRREVIGFSASPHNLLVYRDPGHPTHTTEEVGLSSQARAGSFLAGGTGSFVAPEGVDLSQPSGLRAREPFLAASGQRPSGEAAAPNGLSASPPRRPPVAAAKAHAATPPPADFATDAAAVAATAAAASRGGAGAARRPSGEADFAIDAAAVAATAAAASRPRGAGALPAPPSSEPRPGMPPMPTGLPPAAAEAGAGTLLGESPGSDDDDFVFAPGAAVAMAAAVAKGPSAARHT